MHRPWNEPLREGAAEGCTPPPSCPDEKAGTRAFSAEASNSWRSVERLRI